MKSLIKKISKIHPLILRAKEIFEYHEDGYLILKYSGRSDRLNKKAGGLDSNKYYRVNIDRKSYLGHRIIWAMHNNRMPLDMIDHIDRDTTNNRIENLREATRSQNNINSNVKKSSSSYDLPRGVNPHIGRNEKPCNTFYSKIRKDGKIYYLGTFNTPEEASIAYQKKREELFGEFSP